MRVGYVVALICLMRWRRAEKLELGIFRIRGLKHEASRCPPIQLHPLEGVLRHHQHGRPVRFLRLLLVPELIFPASNNSSLGRCCLVRFACFNEKLDLCYIRIQNILTRQNLCPPNCCEYMANQ